MLDKMKQLMDMKKQADKLKRELEQEVIEVTDVRGIKIVINGAQHVKSIEIDESLINPQNKKKLEMEILKSINIASKKAQTAAALRMQASMPNGFPGF